MADIGVGLIGYGLGGRAFHAPYLRVTPGLHLRAVVSRDPGKVRADLPGMAVVPDVAILLGDAAIDLIVVSSPDDLHAEHALAALHAGKHVVIDKPFATDLADARRIVEVAANRQRLAIAFHNRRWDADFRTLQKLIAGGVLGTVVQFESHFDRWRPAPASVWKEARRGGSWFDLGPHLVDQALQLFGRPTAMIADIATLRDGAPAPDYFHVVLQYPGRRVLLHSSKLVAQHDLRFAVHGTGGSYIKHGVDVQEAKVLSGCQPGGEDWGHDPRDSVLTLGSGESRPIPNERGDYRLFWNAVVCAVRGEGPNPVPPEDALAVLEVLEEGLRSAGQQ